MPGPVRLAGLPLAVIVSRVLFGQRTTARQMAGMAIIVAGVAALLLQQS